MPRSKYRNADAARFGAIITRLRSERGWTLVTLARRSGMHPTYLGVLEKGGNVPTLATMLELAEVLNVNASDLMRELEEERRAARQKRVTPPLATEATTGGS